MNKITKCMLQKIVAYYKWN